MAFNYQVNKKNETMSKLSKRFEFLYPVTKQGTVNGHRTQIHIGDLRVEGVGYEYPSEPDDNDRYDVDIDGIYWDGSNSSIYQLISNASEDLYDKLQTAALHHITELFSNEYEQDQKSAEQIDAIMQERA